MSSSWQRRQRRNNRQQQDHHQRDNNNQRGASNSLSPPTPPYPYHQNNFHQPVFHATPPQRAMREEKPVTSGEIVSSVSDMSMEDFSGAQESVLEYSDTSDDYREERSSYFLQQNSILGNPNMRGKSTGDLSGGESAFRRLHDNLTKSSRVVRFGAGGSEGHVEFTFDDELDDADNEDVEVPLIHKPGSRSAAPPPPPPPPPHRKSGATGESRTSNQSLLKASWVTSLACSFQSTSQKERLMGKNGDDPRKRNRKGGNRRMNRSHQSSSTMEYPHYTSLLPSRGQNQVRASSPSSIPSESPGSWEASPLLRLADHKGVYGSNNDLGDPLQHNSHHSLNNTPNLMNGDPTIETSIQIKQHHDHHQQFNHHDRSHPLYSYETYEGSMNNDRSITIASYFLMDYEAGRPPTLSQHFDSITSTHLRLYRIHFLSWPWKIFGVMSAIIALFAAHTQTIFVTAILHSYAICVFFVEMHAREQLYDHNGKVNSHSDRPLVRPMSVFLVILGLESWFWFLIGPPAQGFGSNIISSVFKPIVFFYASAKARDALEALLRIGRLVTRILAIEVFLILTFAAVACRLFHDYDSFHNLSTSWLSLFELSTTVVNPSLWMPIYQDSRWNSIFFVFFIVTAVFYLHSLVLSVVFQTYIQAASEIHERSASDREDAVRLAFLVLSRDGQTDVITSTSVRKTLQLVRPHYNPLKIKALMEIVDPSNQQVIDYPTFRTKIRQALNASIRTSRSASSFAMAVELIAVLVALTNFVYVILLASEYESEWFDETAAAAGTVITLLGLLELVIRFNPLRVPNFAPITRLNGTFDGLALIGALVSCAGIVKYIAGEDPAIDLILMGRAIDMIRIMRFFQIFRDVVRRSADVLPALAGPIILVLTTVHVFTYIGMGLWGGAIDVEALAQNANVTPLYYLNNFNSYTEGLITIFNVLVVNDWHALAGVFRYADHCSSPLIVYPFFVTVILIAVFIMLNVITAFFVESFVTKLSDTANSKDSVRDRVDQAALPEERDFVIQTGENTNVKRISSGVNLSQLTETDDDDEDRGGLNNNHAGDAASITNSSCSTEIFTFDVYEREGFDQIMKTVAGSSDAQEEAFARSVCDYLEIFESLTPGREKVGYMVCCQRSMSRFGNKRFQSCARDFVKDEVLHRVVSDMHAELLVLSSRKNFEDRCLIRTFPNNTDPSKILEISASLLRHQPAVSILVSRVRRRSSDNLS